MRPVRGTYRGAAVEIDVPGLMEDIGMVCSTCERPLNDFATLWDTDERRTLGHAAPAAESNSLLVICVDCSLADAARDRPSDEELALPNREQTFSLSVDSPFQYSLDDVSVTVYDTEQNREESVIRSLVIVHGSTTAAENTIERFALNTRYYDPAYGTMRISERDVSYLEDRRVEERTRVWLRAEELVADLKPDAARVGRSMRTLREVADMAGFWSVWMTLLRANFEEDDLLESDFATQGTRIRGTALRSFA